MSMRLHASPEVGSAGPQQQQRQGQQRIELHLHRHAPCVAGTAGKGQHVVDECEAGPEQARAVILVEWVHVHKCPPELALQHIVDAHALLMGKACQVK